MTNKYPWIVPILGLSLLLGGCFGPDEAERIASARDFEAKGELRSAAIELKNVLQDNPEQAEARFLLGRLSLASGQPAAAEKELERAERYGYTSPELPLLMARARMAQSRFADVINGLDASQLGAEVQVDGLVLLGYANLGLNQQGEAERYFNSALGQDAGSVDAMVGLALVERVRGHLDQARQHLARALKAQPNHEHGNVVLGEILMQQQAFDQAQVAFRRVIDSQPGDQPMTGRVFSARVGLAQSMIGNGETGPAKAELDQLLEAVPNQPQPMFLRASLAFEDGELERAESLLHGLLKVQPSHHPATFLLGAVNLRQGKLEQANQHLSQVVAAVPDNTQARQLLAQTRLQMGRPDEVIEALGPILDQGKGNTTVMGLLAQANFRLGEPGKGIDVLERAVRENPDDALLKTQLAAAYVDARRFKEAIGLLEGMPSRPNDRRRLHETLLFVAYSGAGQSAKADALVKRLIESAPDDADALVVAGGLRQISGDLDSARKLYDRAIELDANHAAAMFNLGRLDFNLGELDRAERRFSRILEINPNNLEAMLALARVAARRGDYGKAVDLHEQVRSLDANRVDARKALVAHYLSTRELDAAEKIARELLQIDANDAQANNAVGLVALNRGDAQQAAGLFERAVRGDAGNINYKVNLARAYLRTNRPDQARQTLEQGLQQDANHALASAALAEVHLQQGKPDKAYAIAARLQKNDRTDPTGYVIEGQLALAGGEFERAVRAFDSALALRPESAWMVKKYEARKKAGASDLESEVQQWLRDRPEDDAVRMLLAEVYLESGRHERAIGEYETILARQPGNIVVLNNLAWLYDQAGNPKALEVAERAYRQARRNWAVMDTYGWLLVKNDRVNEGLDLLRQAVDDQGASPEVSYHLAVALHRSGRDAEAREALDRALASGAAFDGREEARSLLQSLR